MLKNRLLLWGALITLCIGIVIATRLPHFTGASTANLLNTPFADLSFMNFYFRKMTHFSVYGILAVLFWHALENCRFNYFLAFILSTIIGALDEWHQSFVPGRTFSFTDILINASGVCIFLLALYSKKFMTKTIKSSNANSPLPK